MAQNNADFKAMIKLANSYDFDNIHDYFDYIVESFINGQPQQAKKLFLAMPASYQSFMLTTPDESGLTNEYKNKLTEWAINK